MKPTKAGMSGWLCLAVMLCAWVPAAVRGQQFSWSVWAGTTGGGGYLDGAVAAARFDAPQQVALDAAGNVYIADAGNHCIRKMSSTGTVTTLAGLGGVSGSADGTGTAARFKNPMGIAVDAAGNVYVADTGNYTLRVVTPAGVVTTLAGSAGHLGLTNGTGASARFTYPIALAVDAAGTVYVAEYSASVIRKVTPDGAVTTMTTTPAVVGPRSIAVDSAGNLYVGEDYHYVIRKVFPDGTLTTLAGQLGQQGSTDGTGTGATFGFLLGLTVDSSGTLYSTENTSIIRKITGGGVVTTLAGVAGSTGLVNLVGTSARFNIPAGLAANSTGGLIVADTNNASLRTVDTTTQAVNTLGGKPAVAGGTDGVLTAALFNSPGQLAMDAAGNIYVGDALDHTVRKITPAGVVSTLAGSPGVVGSTDGTGSAARFGDPEGVAVDAAGNVYVADWFNDTIRKVTPAGVVTTLAGASTKGSADGPGALARFFAPRALAVDASGNVFVADTSNHTIRKITPTGQVSTFAGMAGLYGTMDGTGSAARFNNPRGLALDAAGNLYVADYNNCTVRKVSPAGVVTTVAGSPGTSGSGDGQALEATFTSPSGVCIDAVGNIFVADTGSHAIRRVSPDGMVTTVGGQPGHSGNQGGVGALACFGQVCGIVVSSSGALFVANQDQNSILMSPGGAPVVAAGAPGALTSSSAVINGTVNPSGSATTAVFEYGLTTAYGSTATLTLSPADDSAVHAVTATLTGLAKGSYHYRLKAANTLGVATTADAMFTTTGPSAPDTSFNASGFQTAKISASTVGTQVLVRPDGRIELFGYGSNGSNMDFVRARWNVDGSLDTTLGGQGRYSMPVGSSNDYAYGAALQNDGKIVVAGGYYVGATEGLGVMRVNLDGTPDSPFQAAINGQYPGFVASSVAVQPDGKVMFFGFGGAQFNFQVLRCSSAGVVDTTFGTNGLVTLNVRGQAGSPGAVALYPDGRILLAGQGYDGSHYRFTLARLNADGSLDGTLGGSGVVMTQIGAGAATGDEAATCVALQADLKIVVGGWSTNGSNLDATVARYAANGVLDTTFNSTGMATFAVGPGDDKINALCLQANGRILLVGATSNGTYDDMLVIRLTTLGKPDTTFSTNGFSVQAPGTRNNRLASVAMDWNGRIISGGISEDVNGVPQFAVVRLLGDAPGLQVEQPATALVSGDNSLDMGAPGPGASTTKTFTVRNTGTEPLNVYGATFDGANPGDFSVSSNVNSITLAPGGQAAFTVTFTPQGNLARGAVMHVYSTASTSTFDVALTGTGPPAPAPYFSTPATTPNASSSFTAGGYTLGPVSLGFKPLPGMILTLANNTSASPVTGIFTGLPEGSVVNVPYQGVSYAFTISYQGGDGNDVTLTRVAYPGQNPVFTWSHLAGGLTGPGALDGTGAAAQFNSPHSVAVASDGTVYVADTSSHTIRKITSAGVVSTFAGATGAPGFVDDVGANARFSYPQGLAMGSDGSVYVADFGNSAVRKIAADGTVSTLAGNGATGSANGTGAAARFNFPQALAVSSTGIVYVADSNNHTIRKVTSAGVVTTLAGSGTAGFLNSTGTFAQFNTPGGVAVDASGNVYVADTLNRVIRKISSTGAVTTLAGSVGNAGTADGSATVARFFTPTGVCLDASGNLYVGETGFNTIRKITSAGVVSTLAGSAPLGGSVNGIGASARFYAPRGLALSGTLLYVADCVNGLIRTVPIGGTTTTATVAGQVPVGGSTDGTGSAARFADPFGVVADAAGNAYVADNGNNTVRKVTPQGVVTTFAGSAGLFASTDGTGSAARFKGPTFLARDAAGNLYLSETSGSNVIRKITPGAVVTTLAGTSGTNGSTSGSADGTGAAAQFNFPEGLGVDAGGNVYVADVLNYTIRRITPAGVVTTLAGVAGQSGSTDGTGSAARLFNPQGLALDAAGNGWVVGGGIRRFTSAGVVSTPVTHFQNSYSTLGAAMDAAGSLYMTDYNNNVVYRLAPDGTVLTIGGVHGVPGTGDGVGAAGGFYQPAGIHFTTAGLLLVVDGGDNCLRLGTPAYAPTLSAVGVSNVGSTIATLSATVNANGQPTAVTFEYGTSTTYGSTAAASPAGPFSDADDHAVQAVPVHLAPGTLYYYRVTVSNIDGTLASTGSFTTQAYMGADLSALTVSPGTLTPAFDTDITSYQLFLPWAVTSLNLTPTLADVNATATINGSPATSGTAATISGVPVGASVVSIVLFSADGHTQKTYTISVTRYTNAQDWRIQHFGSPDATGDAADDADPDHDGISNFIEFAIGSDPLVWSKPAGVLGVEDGNVTFTYTRTEAALADDLVFTVEWTASLPGTAWSSQGVTETVLSDDGTTQTIKALVPRKGSKPVFVHLKVSVPVFVRLELSTP